MTPDVVPVLDVWLIVAVTFCLAFSCGVVTTAAYLTRR